MESGKRGTPRKHVDIREEKLTNTIRRKISTLGVLNCTFISVIVLLCSLPNAHGADPVFANHTVEDAYGNTADDQSRIIWGALPKGRAYKAGSDYKDGGLAPLFNFARAFLGIVQPNPFPGDLIKGVMDNSFNFGKDYMKVVYYAMGFAVCFAIGLLFIIIMPILGCCFCFCRCCGCCGGKMYQKHSSNISCKRMIFCIVLFVLTAFMAVGMICTYVTSNHMSTAITEIETTGVDNLDDITGFLNNTVEEMNYVAIRGFDFAADVIMRDLDNIGYLVGVPVRDALATTAGVDAAINTIVALDGSISTVATDMFAVNSSIASLKDNGNNLTSQLTDVRNSITTIQTDGGCMAACLALPADDLNMGVDFNALPDISQEVQQMKDVQSESLATKALEGKKEFDDIPWRVVNDTKDIISTLKSQLNSFKSTIKNQLDKVTKMPDQILSPVKDIKKQIKDYGKMIDQYNQYRWYGGVGLAGTIAIIVVLQFLGLLFGIVGSSANTHPTQRGCLSNCGGLMLMAAVGFIFIFSWLLMLLTSISFLIGGNLEKAVCEPLMDPEYKIFKLLDEPGGFLSKDGEYFLGKTLLQNGSVDLTISGMLDSCKNHKAAYTALKLKYLFDLDIVADYKQSIDIDAELAKINDSVSLSDVKILTADAENQLRDFADAVQLNFTGFVDELSKNTTKVNLTDFAAVVRAAKGTSTGTVPAALEAEAVKLEAMDSGIVQDVEESQRQLLIDIQALNQSVAAIPALVNQTIDNVKAAENNLGSLGSALISSEVTKYAMRILGVADSFSNFTLNSIKNDVGDCFPLWNLWYSLIHLILCKYTIDTFNGFWFSLGWAIFFMVPSIIFNVKLAKHFRRMKSADENFKLDPSQDIPLSKNKVAPAL